jgi:protein TonB
MVTINNDPIYQIPPAKKIEPPKPKIEAKPAATLPATPVNTTRFVPPVVVEDKKAEEPPKLSELRGAVGPETVKGAGPGIAPIDAPGKGGEGIAEIDAPDKEYIAVENMPVPNGGTTGWTKFLQNTIRYPREALDKEVSGKVLVSFIVEKDGHLSSIHVERGPGYGMDEEATRVLKLAKPWTPGMQNGKAVRVRLTLPVSFSLGE